MVAPYQKTKETSSTSMRRARRTVASTFLTDEPESGNTGSQIASWKAWMFAGWVVAVTVLYFAYLFGWL